MQYLPSSQSQKNKNLTQEFEREDFKKSESGNCTSPHIDKSDITSNSSTLVNIRDFSDLVKLQKITSTTTNLNENKTQEYDLNNLKIQKAQSTQKLDLTNEHMLVKQTSSIFDLRGDILQQQHPFKTILIFIEFKSHAAPLKQHSQITQQDLFFDDCLDCISQWKEIKSELVKKKTKLIFYADRLLKIYENGYFAYFTSRQSSLKAVIHPRDIVSCVLESKDKMKLSTREKSYLFKFNDARTAQEWVNHISNSISKLNTNEQ